LLDFEVLPVTIVSDDDQTKWFAIGQPWAREGPFFSLTQHLLEPIPRDSAAENLVTFAHYSLEFSDSEMLASEFEDGIFTQYL